MPSKKRRAKKGASGTDTKRPKVGLNNQIPSPLRLNSYRGALSIWSGPEQSAFTLTSAGVEEEEEKAQRKKGEQAPGMS